MSKILARFSFAIASLVLIVAFMTASTYVQLAIAVLFYPLIVYLAFKAFPRKNKKFVPRKSKRVIQLPMKSEEKAEKIEAVESETPSIAENLVISDVDKRTFIKLIGAAGLSFFLFSIFNKKTEGFFSKSQSGSGSVALEDIAGNKIDPPQSQPTDGYRISEVDDDVIAFHGFINAAGAWYILRIDTETGSFRYTKGDSDFPNNWNNRTNFKYDYFNNVF